MVTNVFKMCYDKEFLLSIHLEVQDFGDEHETNYKTNEVNKENMNSAFLIADQKSENTKHMTKYDKQTLRKFCQKKNKWRINLQLFHIFK